VVVNYFPWVRGRGQALRQAALEAGAASSNWHAVFISSDREWAAASMTRGCRSVGDDIKSQSGLHHHPSLLARLFEDRGVRLTTTYQLNFGRNMTS